MHLNVTGNHFPKVFFSTVTKMFDYLEVIQNKILSRQFCVLETWKCHTETYQRITAEVQTLYSCFYKNRTFRIISCFGNVKVPYRDIPADYDGCFNAGIPPFLSLFLYVDKNRTSKVISCFGNMKVPYRNIPAGYDGCFNAGILFLWARITLLKVRALFIIVLYRITDDAM